MSAINLPTNQLGDAPEPFQLEWLTLREFKERYVYNQGRFWLFEGMLRAAEELRKCGCSAIYVGGSFVDSEEHPEDYDAVFETVGLSSNVDPAFFDATRRQECTERYRGDWLMGRLGDPIAEQWIRFLASDREGKPRTIIAVKLRLDEIRSL